MTFSTRQMTVLALFAAIMCIVSPLSISIGPIPLTLATFVLYLTVAVLETSGTISVTLYVLLGTVGLPVFSGWQGGLDKILGPTGGYIAGYIPCAFIAGVIIEVFGKNKIAYPIAMACGTVVLYALGTTWFIASNGINGNHYSIGAALMLCVVKFLPGDAIKIAAASALGIYLRKVLAKHRVALQ